MRSNRARNPTTRNPTKQPTQKNTRWSFIEKKKKKKTKKKMYFSEKKGPIVEMAMVDLKSKI